LAVLHPREGGLRRGENCWLLTTASAQCLRLSERFFISSDVSILFICRRDYSETTDQIFTKFYVIVGHNPRTSRLDFGVNPVLDPDQEFLKGILPLLYNKGSSWVRQQSEIRS